MLTSLDWDSVKSDLYFKSKGLPYRDVTRMLNSIGDLVKELGAAEIEAKRLGKKSTLRSRDRLTEINNRIEEFEMQVVFGQLCKR